MSDLEAVRGFLGKFTLGGFIDEMGLTTDLVRAGLRRVYVANVQL